MLNLKRLLFNGTIKWRGYLPLTLLVLCFGFSQNVGAQIDRSSGSFRIPAVEDTTQNEDPQEIEKQELSIDSEEDEPKVPSSINPNIPENRSGSKGGFHMMDQEQFADAGKRYTEQANETQRALRENHFGPLHVSDQYLGTFRTKSKVIRIRCRDYGEVDGDMIRINLNSSVVYPRITMSGSTRELVIHLQEGENQLDFEALNVGFVSPNTASFTLIDEQGNVITGNLWTLLTNDKAKITIIKE